MFILYVLAPYWISPIFGPSAFNNELGWCLLPSFPIYCSECFCIGDVVHQIMLWSCQLHSHCIVKHHCRCQIHLQERQSVDAVASVSELAVMPVCFKGHGAGHLWDTIFLIQINNREYSGVDNLQERKGGTSAGFDEPANILHTLSINPCSGCYRTTC